MKCGNCGSERIEGPLQNHPDEDDIRSQFEGYYCRDCDEFWIRAWLYDDEMKALITSFRKEWKNYIKPTDKV